MCTTFIIFVVLLSIFHIWRVYEYWASVRLSFSYFSFQNVRQTNAQIYYLFCWCRSVSELPQNHIVKQGHWNISLLSLVHHIQPHIPIHLFVLLVFPSYERALSQLFKYHPPTGGIFEWNSIKFVNCFCLCYMTLHHNFFFFWLLAAKVSWVYAFISFHSFICSSVTSFSQNQFISFFLVLFTTWKSQTKYWNLGIMRIICQRLAV